MKFYSFIIVIAISACQSRWYKVTENYVESNIAFESGFLFYSLQVDSVDIDSVPVKFSILHKYSVDPIDTLAQLPTRIYFYYKSETYKWYDFASSRMMDTLPVKFEIGGWYLISGLMGDYGTPNRRVYIHITDYGEYKFYYSNKKTNW